MPDETIINTFNDLQALPPGKNAYTFFPASTIKGWKLHVCLNKEEDVYPDLNDPLVRSISKFLIDRKINHKYASGNDGFKTFAIYTSSMEEARALAKELEHFNMPETDSDLEQGDLFLSNAIYMRFTGQEYRAPQNAPALFMRYGHKGMPSFAHRYTFADIGTDVTAQDKILLHTLAAHVLCAEYYGSNYLGKNYAHAPWDRDIFMPLTEKYTEEEIALYIKNALIFARATPHFINQELKAQQPIAIDIKALLTASKVESRPTVSSAAQLIIDKF
jgi:hypothetical protein